WACPVSSSGGGGDSCLANEPPPATGPTGGEGWQKLETVQQTNVNNPGAPILTTGPVGLPDGTYDLSVSADDIASSTANGNTPDSFIGGLVTDVQVDNTPPT